MLLLLKADVQIVRQERYILPFAPRLFYGKRRQGRRMSNFGGKLKPTAFFST
jgi:hypothetical protein